MVVDDDETPRVVKNSSKPPTPCRYPSGNRPQPWSRIFSHKRGRCLTPSGPMTDELRTGTIGAVMSARQFAPRGQVSGDRLPTDG